MPGAGHERGAAADDRSRRYMRSEAFAGICKPDGRRRLQNTSIAYDQGQPTPIFRGRR